LKNKKGNDVKSFYKISFAMVIALFVVLAFYNLTPAGTHSNNTTTVTEYAGKVTYSGAFEFADSASGAIYYSQAILIAPFTNYSSFGYFICSEAGTEDVNVFVEYSRDRTTWYAGTTNSALDAVGTTAVHDTLDVIAGATDLEYLIFPWARLKFVAGQNMNSSTMTWNVSFTKPPEFGYAGKLGKVLNSL